MAKDMDPPSSVRESSGSLSKLVAELEGVGPARAKHLRSLGIESLGDLLEYFPRTYQSETAELDIGQLTAGEQIQTARGRVVAVDYVPIRPRPRFEATLEDDNHRKLALVWFNGAWLRQRIHPGKMIRVQGRCRMYHNIPQMANPKWEEVDEAVERIDHATFRPIYPATANLPSDLIARLVAENLEDATRQIEEWFSPELLKLNHLISRREAYRWIHQPADMRQAMRAR